MTTRTRRQLVTALAAIILTLPAESILVKAVTISNPAQGAQQWAASLSAADLAANASVIQAYPFAYRKAILARLTPQQRSAVWRNHIAMYIQANPGLSPDTVATLDAAIAVASPEALSAPTDDIRAEIKTIADQITAELGADQAQYLLYRLGPPDGTFASAEPVSLRLANWARRMLTVKADDDSNCDCNLGWGCSGFGQYCSGSTGCTVVQPWPACGWLLDSNCDGNCLAGFFGS